jgi:DNA-binding NtrC family response regulator
VKTILIVDDDENVRVMCERKLADQGYITHSVSSGAEALEFVSKNPHVDLVVLDVKMAPLNGIQVLKTLRTRKVNIPVILHSDYSTYKRDFDAWFADAYVVKSSDLTQLKAKIKELLSFEV